MSKKMVVLRKGLQITGTLFVGTASVMKAFETEETVRKLLIKVAPKVLKKMGGS